MKTILKTPKRSTSVILAVLILLCFPAFVAVTVSAVESLVISTRYQKFSSEEFDISFKHPRYLTVSESTRDNLRNETVVVRMERASYSDKQYDRVGWSGTNYAPILYMQISYTDYSEVGTYSNSDEIPELITPTQFPVYRASEEEILERIEEMYDFSIKQTRQIDNVEAIVLKTTDYELAGADNATDWKILINEPDYTISISLSYYAGADNAEHQIETILNSMKLPI